MSMSRRKFEELKARCMFNQRNLSIFIKHHFYLYYIDGLKTATCIDIDLEDPDKFFDNNK